VVMKIMSFVMVVVLLAACGKEELSAGNPLNPSQPLPPNASWASVMTSETNRCAAGEFRKYPAWELTKWSSFCGCVYRTAQARWSPESFRVNFNSYYNTLRTEGVIQGCLNDAGINSNVLPPNF